MLFIMKQLIFYFGYYHIILHSLKWCIHQILTANTWSELMVQVVLTHTQKKMFVITDSLPVVPQVKSSPGFSWVQMLKNSCCKILPLFIFQRLEYKGHHAYLTCYNFTQCSKACTRHAHVPLSVKTACGETVCVCRSEVCVNAYTLTNCNNMQFKWKLGN